MSKTALVIGATGLVGSHLVNQLLDNDSYSRVKVFGRSIPELKNPKLKAYKVDFDIPGSWRDELVGDVLFSTLGTTIKKAGNKENQYKVDYTYQFNTAKFAAHNNVTTLVLVSSLGANSKSKIFYSRIKGELDESVGDLGFKHVFILRPSALVGKRDEERAGESMMIKVMNVMCAVLPFLKKYKPIPAETVARAMINVALKEPDSQYSIIDNPDIFTKADN